MPWLTMEICRYRKRKIGHSALYIPLLCIMFLVSLRLHRYALNHIRSHASSTTCCVQFNVPFFNVSAGWYVRCLHLEQCGGLTGVYIAAVSRQVAHSVKSLTLSLIRRTLHIEEVFQEAWLAVVETWGRWSRKDVGSAEDFILCSKYKWNEWEPTCMFNSKWILLHIAARDCNDHAISVSRSDVGCLITGIHQHERQRISRVCSIDKAHSLTERTSGDLSLQRLPGSYMNHTVTRKS
jgi:hypothetical protein